MSKNEPHIDLITKFLDGTLSAGEKRKYQQLLDEGKIDKTELDELKKLTGKMERIDRPEPHHQVQERFYKMLEEEKTRQKKGFVDSGETFTGSTASSSTTDSSTGDPIAGTPGDSASGASGNLTNRRVGVRNRNFSRILLYAASFFLAGLLIGDLFAPISDRDDRIEQLSSEIYQMREMMMIQLLENDSATERLRAVNISNDLPSSADRVAEALIRALNNDPNVNVRIAAVDALVRHASDPGVRQRMVDSIGNQNSPAVQIALADAMVALQEENAIDEFRKLIRQNSIDDHVRNKFENTIAALLQ